MNMSHVSCQKKNMRSIGHHQDTNDMERIVIGAQLKKTRGVFSEHPLKIE